jgi:putative SOS response-associated peptidase YedK
VGPDGGELDTCCVLTTAPNDLLRRVHDRMPVVIPDGLEEPWLAPADGPGLRALEPLMAPWDPAAWEAVKLDVGPDRDRPDSMAGQPGQLDLLLS